MTYQHQGKRFNNESKNKKNINKRFFMLNFQCAICNKSNRLKELKVDFMGRFQCPYCDSNSFAVRKKRVGETSILEKDTVIIIEKKTTIGRRIK